MSSIFKNDYGTVFEITVKENGQVIDLSAATAIVFIFNKPDSSQITRTAAFKTDGTDGIVKTTIQSGDFLQVGSWSVQIKVTFTYGEWRTTKIVFNVVE